MAFNIVEFMEDPEECAFDQPCKFGHRTGGHAVYCHNDEWSDGPRKCRRSWYSGGEIKDEDCPGFQPNPEFVGTLAPSPILTPLCKKCKGKRITKASRDLETCQRCRGEGTEPSAMKLTAFQQDTLEMGCTMGGYRAAPGERFMRLAETRQQSKEILAMAELNLVVIRSMGGARDVTGFLLETTGKGDAVMRANWAKKNSSPPLK